MEWSPCEVLKIVDLSTCAGSAATTGRRCRSRLAAYSVETAEALLDEMSFLSMSDEAGTMKLMESLAPHLLCSQWHQEQAPRLVEQWKIRVLDSQKTDVMQKIEESSKELEDITSRLEKTSLAGSHSLQSRDRTTTPITVTLPLERNSVPGDAASMFRFSGITFGCIDESPISHPNLTSSPPQYQSHHGKPNRRVSSTGRVRSRQPSTSREPASRYKNQNRNHKFAHDTKKDCPICLEATKADPHSVARCPGCLEVFHEGCVDLSTDECKTNGANLTCPFCRLNWKD